MIKIENLTKIYKSKKKERCKALDDLTFTLDDKGFVFVIGKSGSGKTTLLSIIGGLEEMTSGNITVNGRSLKNKRNKEFVGYRNSTIGYIFQDFHLIDELTIAENVAVSLELQGVEKTDEIVSKALSDVGLGGYETRYPKELSGGEKQRIAIARALVKNPSIILADEPTGNLDTKTTTQILTLLKQLSQDRLVVIVSHNLNDAADYADRIIELSQGKIINDYVRNLEYSEEVRVEDGTLIIPIRKKFTDKDHVKINDLLKKGEIKKIVQTDEAFIKNEEKLVDTHHVASAREKTKTKHITPKDAFKLSLKFLKKDMLRLCIYAFITACLIIVLGLSELIVTFDSAKIVNAELLKAEQTTLSLLKSEVSDTRIQQNTNCIVDITDEEIKTFYENGYKGNIYKLVHHVFEYGTKSGFAQVHVPVKFNPLDAYYNGTRGTLITTEEYIEKLFGKVEYLALADKIEDGGVYITDYSADAMIYYNTGLFPDYKATLGHNRSAGYNVFGYVNGVIYTGYKEKYQEIMKSFQNADLTKEELLEMTSSEEYRRYYDDVIQNLSVSYTTNENFVDDMVALNSKTWCSAGNSVFEVDGENYTIPNGFFFQNAKTRSYYDLKEGEIVMDYKRYNAIFGTDYNESTIEDFSPQDVVFKYSHYYDANSSAVQFSFKAKIVLLDTSDSIYLADENFKTTLKYNTITSGIYFDDISDVTGIMKTAEENGFSANSVVALSLTTMTKAVSVFSDFFAIIFIGLCVCAFYMIASYGAKLIKDRKYEIGILKALGIRDVDLIFIFGLQILLLFVLIVALYILGSLVFIDLANDVLIRSLLELASNSFIMDIKVLYVNPYHFFVNGLLTGIIVLISFSLPLVKLRKLKPTNIIKAKE